MIAKIGNARHRTVVHTAEPRESLTDVGGADRDRTDDPLLAKQVLSQLSYSPIGSAFVGLKIKNPDRHIYRCANLNSQSIPWWA